MKAIDDCDHDHGPEHDESELQAAERLHPLDTSIAMMPPQGEIPGWAAYQRYGYSIWRFDGVDWQVVVSKCSVGAVCGLPPKEAGQYVGEHRKKNCEPAPAIADLPCVEGAGVGVVA